MSISPPVVMSFNEVSEQARKASLKWSNWFKTIVVVKHPDPNGYGYGYTYYPDQLRSTQYVQAAYLFGRRLK